MIVAACAPPRTPILLLLLLAVLPSGAIGETLPQRQAMRTFSGESLRAIAFPIGGIGTGSVSLGGRGELRDWEIFTHPDKNNRPTYTFFGVWAKQKGKKPIARVLERRPFPSYLKDGFGMPQRELLGLPRLTEAEFTGEYPFAHVRFRDSSLPVVAELEAWNPFIPLNVDDSALPVALLTWTFRNPTKDTVELALAANLANPIGSTYTSVKNKIPGLGGNMNDFREDEHLRGIFMSSRKVQPDDPNFGTLALATWWKDVGVQTRWYRGPWWDQCHLFWDDFADDGRVTEVRDTIASPDGRSDVGSLILRATIPPRGSVQLPVAITWHFPNRENYWNPEPEVSGKLLRNYVAKKFTDAWHVARYVERHRQRLEDHTRAFHRALFSTSLPPVVLDAVSSQMSTLKTNVCILLEDGSFYGFEGTGDKTGCCPMNCTHVWNYEQTLALLFPQLERSMRETDFLHNTLPNGYMVFRTMIPLGAYHWRYKAAADGQNGAIMRAYREWKLSGDTEWLQKLWPKVVSALEFSWKGSGNPPPPPYEWTKELIPVPWDADKDGMMEGEQHNTYDIEFYGPNTMTGTNYLGALKAASEMARTLGDLTRAEEYATRFAQGRKLYDDRLWNGEYYHQEVSVPKGLEIPKHLASPRPDGTVDPTPKYQYGKGCLSDQLLGQYLAHVMGLGYLLNEDHVRKASRSIFRHNFKKTLADFPNVQRVYALNDEAGLLLCTWPKGDRPTLPFVYSDEVWTGIEYQVAAQLIYDGWVKEGLEIVKGVRDRYAGHNRNPWDEEECGHHYARAMASWSLLLALTGYQYDGVEHRIAFTPATREREMRTFWSCGTGWGEFHSSSRGSKGEAHLHVLYGSLDVGELLMTAAGSPQGINASVGNSSQNATVTSKGGVVTVRFDPPVQLGAGERLDLSW